MQKIETTMRVDAIVIRCISFKIGKTGQSKEARLAQYKADPNEADYKYIEYIFPGNKQDVSDMESFLINYYKDHLKCDNRKDGEASKNDDMAEDVYIYHVYVVWE